MAKEKPPAKRANDPSTATIGVEAKLWLTADSRSAAEPKRSEDSPASFLPNPGQTAEGNRSHNMDAAETSGASKSERSGIEAQRRQPKANTPTDLHRLGLAKNTLVIFSSDNGASPINEGGHLPNGPWRGKKSQLWEGGHREPFIARWPGHIAPGTTSDDLVCLVDLAATAAGEKLPDGAAPDSFNLLPTLLGQPKRMKRDNPRLGEVRNQNYEGRIRPQSPHQAVCAAHHPPVRKSAEIDGSPGAGQTTAPLGNIGRGELSGRSSRTKQSRMERGWPSDMDCKAAMAAVSESATSESIHRQKRRLASGTGRIRVLAGTPRRWRNRASGKAATAPCRVRRTDSDFRHDHQESAVSRMKAEGRMQKSPLLHSSFLLPTFPVLAVGRQLLIMARTKSNGTNTSTASIGFEAGTESSPELQLARARVLSAKVRVVLEPEDATQGSRVAESPVPCRVKRKPAKA